ncbi:aldehyde dehydrogenase family protein [Marmoricola sp. RAF53]|uniref:aldehyde dehydrogenase family protein n=1 Tax=Marmoricola sp. RAF53 TaxID=3233059 RepID=UPI003F95936A
MTTYAVTDPATGELVREYATHTDEEVGAAVAAAHAATTSWGRETTVEERAAVVRRIGELHVERADALGAIASREMGKAAAAGAGEARFAGAIFSYYADNAAVFLAEEPITLLGGEGTAVIRKSPVGVLLGIMPWNYPFYQVARFAGPNLVAGNTIVLKHAPQCPESAAAIEEIFRDAGVPEGAYVNVYATNEQVADVIADPRVRGVSLTGSERAGAAVAEIAGRHLKKVVLELGGSDPFILLGTDDLEATVAAAASARLDNAGQACNAAKRIIVHEDLYDDFVAKFTATVVGTTTTPLSSLAAADRLEKQVAAIVADGGQLATQGERQGAQFPAGVLTDIDRNAESSREELFGPVAMVFKVRDEDEAVEVANDTQYGLGSYLFTTDPAQAERVADRLEVGMVFVNGVGLDSMELPFGGVKRSGFGRELGRAGVEEFINRKLIRTVR